MEQASPPKPNLSIVIPAFNEEARLGRTLTDTLAFLALRPYVSDVLVVDDGSTDRTVEIAESFSALSNGTLRVLKNQGNRGKGFAVRHGVMNAQGDVVLFFDADLSTPLSEVTKLVTPLQEGRCDLAIGSRRAAERSTQTWLRQQLGREFKRARELVLGIKYDDTQCGFKAARREVAHAVFGHQRLDGFAFDVELLMIAREQGWRVEEIPVEWTHQEGSKVRPVVSSMSMLRDVLRLRVERVQRGSVRRRTRAAVRLVGKDGTADDGFLRNMSEGGTFVCGTRGHLNGDPVTLLLPLPEGKLLPLYGTIAHTSLIDGDRGLGIQFRDLDDETKLRLSRFLERL